MKIIGRDLEIEELKSCSKSDRPEFLAVYGRRRIGKTYLIKNFFDNQFDFYTTGVANTSTKNQLKNFYTAINEYFTPKKLLKFPDDWFDAFGLLKQFLESTKKAKKKKQIVFLDELPWFDNSKSNFIQALEYFWNSYASTQNILLIVCGSSASWMIHRLIRNRGGLHNRLTAKMKLEPFNLNDCEAFFKQKGAAYQRYEIIQLYMILGGVPYYLDMLDFGLSITQNIHKLCFTENGKLSSEFDDLYHALYKNADNHLAIIEALSTKNKGLTRSEILKITKLPNAGSTSRTITELIESGFVKEYLPFGGKKQNRLFQLVDFFSMFYLKFVNNQNKLYKRSWVLAMNEPAQRAWSGYAFEMVCFRHILQINKTLGISGVQTQASSWTGYGWKKGPQIDLLIDRRDDVINLCEIKFSTIAFTISKKYAEEIMNKVEVFREATGTHKSIFLTFITPFGLKDGPYKRMHVQNDLTMDALFEKD